MTTAEQSSDRKNKELNELWIIIVDKTVHPFQPLAHRCGRILSEG